MTEHQWRSAKLARYARIPILGGMPEGRLGHWGFSKETAYGTPVAASRYAMFHNETFSTKIQEVIPPQFTGFFDEGPSYLGLREHAGRIVFTVYPQSFGLLLLAYGNDVVSGVGPGYTHTYGPRQTSWGTNSVVQPYTFEIHRDFATAFQYAGAAIDRLRLRWGVRGAGGAGGGGGAAGGDQAMLGEIDGFAKAMTRIAPTTPTYDNVANPFMWNQCAITLASSAYNTIQDIEIEFDFGVEGKPYIDGTREIQSCVARAPRIVHVRGTMLADNAQFVNYDTRVRQDMNLAFTGNLISGAAHYSLTFDFPQAQYIAYPVEIPGFQEIMVAFQAKAKFDPNIANTPAQIILINDVVPAYSA